VDAMDQDLLEAEDAKAFGINIDNQEPGSNFGTISVLDGEDGNVMIEIAGSGIHESG